jgi:hypothetical protein
MDVDYRVAWTTPGDHLRLRIDVEQAGARVFAADLELSHTSLDARRAISLPIRYPLMPLRGLATIYREAMRLLVRRVPVHAHPRRRRSPR